MPLVTIYANEIDKEKKQTIASELTEMIADAYNIPVEMISVYFIPLAPTDAFDAGLPARMAEEPGAETLL